MPGTGRAEDCQDLIGNTTEAAAEDVLVELADHVPSRRPARPPPGRPGPRDGPPELLTATGLWSLEQGKATRYMELDGGRREVTRWCEGVEVYRVLGSAG